MHYMQWKQFKEKVQDEIGEQSADLEAQLKKFKDKKIPITDLFSVFVKAFDEAKVDPPNPRPSTSSQST